MAAEGEQGDEAVREGGEGEERPQVAQRGQLRFVDGRLIETFVWPNSGLSELQCIPIPKTVAAYCTRCGQISTGTQCYNCGQDFTQTLETVFGSDDAPAPAPAPAPGADEPNLLFGASPAAGERVRRRLFAPASAAQNTRKRLAEEASDDEEGAFATPAKRRRKLAIAQAGIEMQREILRRERRRLRVNG
ncbi:hypothetical protein F5Y10DRAFT_267739 [Nemania abortiva]|nr:hypothetical protein F5Y10DRAFT_267739 [Nemania abortiva]